jgi:hypothetical protein
MLTYAAGLKTHPRPVRGASVGEFGRGQDITHGKDIPPSQLGVRSCGPSLVLTGQPRMAASKSYSPRATVMTVAS